MKRFEVFKHAVLEFTNAQVSVSSNSTGGSNSKNDPRRFLHGNSCLWSMMKKPSVSLACKGLCISRFCVMSWKGESDTNIKYCLGRTVGWFKDIHHNTELWTQLTENRWNSSGIHLIAARRHSPSVHKQNGRPSSKDELSSCRCSMTSFREVKTMKRNVLLIPHLCLNLFAKRFPAGRWSFLGPGSETKWYSTYNERPGGKWDRVAESMVSKFGERGLPVFRATSPLSRGALKSKGDGKLSIHFCADGDTIETVFRTIISVNQLSIHGAVSDLCEEYSACQTRTGGPILAGQFDPLFEPPKLLITTPTPSIENPPQKETENWS